MPSQIGHHLNEFLPNLITGRIGQIGVVELGGNPLRLHCMPAQLNWTGRIEWKSIEITWYACLLKALDAG